MLYCCAGAAADPGAVGALPAATHLTAESGNLGWAVSQGPTLAQAPAAEDTSELSGMIPLPSVPASIGAREGAITQSYLMMAAASGEGDNMLICCSLALHLPA